MKKFFMKLLGFIWMTFLLLMLGFGVLAIIAILVS